jgi:phytoene synthase
VTPETLHQRRTDERLRAALAEQVERVGDLSRRAARTIPLLHPSVRDCIDTARVLYCGIAEQVAADDYAVFEGRSRVPRRRRLAVASRALVRARRARRRFGPGSIAAPDFSPGARPVARSSAPAAHHGVPERPTG